MAVQAKPGQHVPGSNQCTYVYAKEGAGCIKAEAVTRRAQRAGGVPGAFFPGRRDSCREHGHPPVPPSPKQGARSDPLICERS